MVLGLVLIGRELAIREQDSLRWLSYPTATFHSLHNDIDCSSIFVQSGLQRHVLDGTRIRAITPWAHPVCGPSPRCPSIRFLLFLIIRKRLPLCVCAQIIYHIYVPISNQRGRSTSRCRFRDQSLHERAIPVFHISVHHDQPTFIIIFTLAKYFILPSVQP